MTTYQNILQITSGDYNLSCSEPLSDIKSLIVKITYYNPYSEERRFLKDRALEKLRAWRDGLILGGCKK